MANPNSRITLINLLGTDVAKILIDYSHFRLYFPPQTNYRDASTTYQALLKKFADLDYFEDYETLDKEYKTFRYNQHWYTMPFGWLDFVWWDYGYKKWLVFVWIAGLLIVFTLINYRLVGKLSSRVYELDNLSSSEVNRFGNRWRRRLYHSFVYTTVVFFSFNVKREKLHYTNKWLLIYFFFIFTLGLICLAYLANFVLKN